MALRGDGQEVEILTGFMQPYLIFCPLGHVMELDYRGHIDKMTGECLTPGCVHYRIKYKIIMPMVSLKKVEDDG